MHDLTLGDLFVMVMLFVLMLAFIEACGYIFFRIR
jgi:hypothetical protein